MIAKRNKKKWFFARLFDELFSVVICCASGIKSAESARDHQRKLDELGRK